MLTNPTNIHKNWPEPNFWLLQISGWLFYMLFVYMAYHVQRYDSWVDVLVYYIYEVVAVPISVQGRTQSTGILFHIVK
ncbi:hypothetical protein [Catenovulum agarivorans]|uniref:hypothetical protein n=1 Tax=Catenovulum agarivorans TaxID=1172192 RepID=UPI0002E74175|nr:hypothetical protein [Catenovulum agarivorans]